MQSYDSDGDTGNQMMATQKLCRSLYNFHELLVEPEYNEGYEDRIQSIGEIV